MATPIDHRVLIEDLDRHSDLGQIPRPYTMVLDVTDDPSQSRRIDFGGGGPEVTVTGPSAVGALLVTGLVSEPALIASGELKMTGAMAAIEAMFAAMRANAGLAGDIVGMDLGVRWRGATERSTRPGAFPETVTASAADQRWLAAWILASLPPECQAGELPRILPRPAGKFKRQGVPQPDELLRKMYACAAVLAGAAPDGTTANPDAWAGRARSALADQRPARTANGHLEQIRGQARTRNGGRGA